MKKLSAKLDTPIVQRCTEISACDVFPMNHLNFFSEIWGIFVVLKAVDTRPATLFNNELAANSLLHNEGRPCLFCESDAASFLGITRGKYRSKERENTIVAFCSSALEYLKI